MVLSDNDIRGRLERGEIKIVPAPDLALQLQPASIDLRLGFQVREFNRAVTPPLEPTDADRLGEFTTCTTLREGEQFILHPGQFVLAQTLERIEVPRNLAARVYGRDSFRRLGVMIYCPEEYLSPSFSGVIELEMTNINQSAIAIYPGMRICQIAFVPVHQ